ncbi:olfactory receptor 1361-like [Prionailurus bengalensis]|uniref:olfactory receptor 1361-like n=1 Tax=Prionailurus bengalensis TaxID=37029 RepID=UPI001CA9320C|nr:olfactory receptor 1361-like [Prionailurus bengalensis]
MAIKNQTSVSDFLLLGFSAHPEQQPLLFGLFLGMYLVTVLGNLLIIMAIGSDQHLHTPMYFFLANLSFVDTCFTCTIVPKVLANILTQRHAISHTGCLVQMYFFMALTLLDDFLLAVMAYDRYVAICLPLHYTTIMCPQRCLLLVAASWLCSHLLASSLTLLMSQFSFCASHAIPHFFCDVPPLLKLACSDTQIFQVTMLTEAVLSGMIPLTCVLVSYAHIMHTVLRIPSAGGKHKVFSTCGSHLSVVTLFYATLFLVYFQPSSSYSADTGMVVSVIYTMVTPMLNPFIYSLRNRDMKGALWRLFAKRLFFEKIIYIPLMKMGCDLDTGSHCGNKGRATFRGEERTYCIPSMGTGLQLEKCDSMVEPGPGQDQGYEDGSKQHVTPGKTRKAIWSSERSYHWHCWDSGDHEAEGPAGRLDNRPT